MASASFLPSVAPDDDVQTRSIRWLITSVTAALFVAALSYGLYRAWLGPVQVIDTVVTLREGSTHTWKLKAGTYEITMKGNGTLALSLPGSNCTGGHGASYSQTCQLALPATLTVAHANHAASVTYSLVVKRL